MKQKWINLLACTVIMAAAGCMLFTPQPEEGVVILTATRPIPTKPSPTLPPPTSQPPTANSPGPMAKASLTPTLARASKAITITTVTMLSQETGWAIGNTKASSAHVLKTGDGGSSWRDVTPAQALLTSTASTKALGYFKDADQAWVTFFLQDSPPDLSMVWRTQDGGQSWEASQPLDINGLENVYFPSHLQFIDSQTGRLLVHVGVGLSHDYVAFFMTDDGVNWARILDPYNDGNIQACTKNAMLFTDPLHGWLTGSCSGVATGVWLHRSSDGGRTWQPVELPTPKTRPDLFSSFKNGCGSNHPTFMDNQTGFIAVSCERFDTDPRITDYFIYATKDGGETWAETSYPGGALVFFDHQTGLALGKEIYKTEDGSRSWTKISTVTWDGDFSFPSQELGWAVARTDDQIALVRSKNGGQTWEVLKPRLIP